MKNSNEIELVDLVDASGNVQKRGIPRYETDNHANLHLQIIIGVIFDDEGRILVHQRARTKSVNPGDIDHVCGAVISGETPEEAFVRESLEETGVFPKNTVIITQGVNKYNRYRYLVVGESSDLPGKPNLKEVEWIQFIQPEELRARYKEGEFSFVDEFFKDTELAIQSKL